MPKYKLTKYNPCHCGSGLYYAYCHKTIDEADRIDRLEAAHTQYRSNWATNATHFAQTGLYEWMAAKLKPLAPKAILDIGTGTGEGLLALVRAYDCKIVSIEENRACLRTASAALANYGCEVTAIERLQFVPMDAELHRLDVLQGRLMAGPQVTLLEADWLAKDHELFSFLGSLPKFDAVTVWLIGTHSLRPESLSAVTANAQNAAHYRIFVQNRVYEVADKVLRSGGILQVVDRGVPLNTEERRKIMREAHEEQASVTDLQVIDLDSTPYTEPEGAARIKMQATKGTSKHLVRKEPLEIVSVLSRKP